MRSAAALCRHLTTDRRTDGELLAAFITGPSEDAFAELVRRHGPLVWSACRRLLPDPTDAEDAFQTAFLILVRRARGLTGAPALGPWLHQVAALTARGIRRKNARRLAHRADLTDQVRDPARPTDADLKADLDAALLALPAHYRDPIVLCHLQGFSRREAAERLGCPEGTLSAWLNRGLEMLRRRLRGLNPTQVLTAATTGVPVALTTSTTQAAVATAVAAASVPPAVSLFVKGVIQMFWVKKATAAAFALTAVFALGVGVGLGTRTGYTGAGAQDEAPAPKAKTKSSVDLERDIAALEKAIQEKAMSLEMHASDTRRARKGFELQRRLMINGPANDSQAAMDVEVALSHLAKAQRIKEQTEAELKELKTKLDKLKTADPVPQIAIPQDIDNDPEVIAQRKKMDHARTEYEFRFHAADDKNAPGIQRLKTAYEEQKKKYEELRKKKIDAQLADLKDQITRLTLERDQRIHQAKEAAASLGEAEQRLVHQKQVAAELAAKTEQAKQISDVERDIVFLQERRNAVRRAVQLEQSALELMKGATRVAPKDLLNEQIAITQLREKLEATEAQLNDTRKQLAVLKGTAVKGLTERLELTVSGQGTECEFVIREASVDSDGVTKQETGPVTTRDPIILAKVLMRAKNAPNGPQHVVLIAQSQTTITTGPGSALKACRTAGYGTVKFTGYVFSGGEAVPLNPNQSGSVRGYKWYDAAEVKPADLLKEIEDGMRRF